MALSSFPERFGANENNRYFGDAAPAASTDGTFNVGDEVLRYPPVVGQPRGWSCTVAGAPGTWVAWANL